MSIAQRVRDALLAEFIESGLAKSNTCLRRLQDNSGELLSIELHNLGGEAALLGLDSIATMSRNAETYAKRWNEGDMASRAECARIIKQISAAIQGLGLASEGRKP